VIEPDIPEPDVLEPGVLELDVPELNVLELSGTCVAESITAPEVWRAPFPRMW
jgi:hypothetical protein